MTSPETARRLRIATALSDEIAAAPGVLALFVVGSAARGIAGPTSDLDLIRIVETSGACPGYEAVYREGVRVGIEAYVESDLERALAARFLDLKTLRDFGRLGAGVLLACRRESLEHLGERTRDLALAPGAAAPLFAQAHAHLDRAADPAAGHRARYVALHGGATALAILALARTPVRYQKPKWVVRDLADSRPDAAPVVLEPFAAGSRRHAERFVGRGAVLIRAVLAAPRPPSADAKAFGYDHAYLAGTVEDAVDLLAGGDAPGAVFTTVQALRMTAAFAAKWHPAAGGLPAEARGGAAGALSASACFRRRTPRESAELADTLRTLLEGEAEAYAARYEAASAPR